MVRAIAKLVSLPFLWLGQLAGAFGLPLGAELLKVAWAISGDGAVARAALIQIQRHSGVDVARAEAGAWLKRRPRPEVAAWAGALAIGAGDVEHAGECLARGRQLGDDPSGMFELLDLMIASRSGDVRQYQEMAASLEARRDLAPPVRKMVLEEALWTALLAGRFDEARRRAEHLLAVDRNAPAHMALYALARRAGRDARAEKHLARTAATPPAERLFYRFLGNLAIGAAPEAGEDLAELRALDAALARRADQVRAAAGGTA